MTELLVTTGRYFRCSTGGNAARQALVCGTGSPAPPPRIYHGNRMCSSNDLLVRLFEGKRYILSWLNYSTAAPWKLGYSQGDFHRLTPVTSLPAQSSSSALVPREDFPAQGQGVYMSVSGSQCPGLIQSPLIPLTHNHVYGAVWPKQNPSISCLQKMEPLNVGDWSI